MVSVVKMELPEDQDPKDLKVRGEKPELLVPMDSQDNVENPVLEVHKEDLALKDLKGHKAREDLLESVVQPDQEENLDHKDHRENQEEMVCTDIILNAFGSEYMAFSQVSWRADGHMSGDLCHTMLSVLSSKLPAYYKCHVFRICLTLHGFFIILDNHSKFIM